MRLFAFLCAGALLAGCLGSTPEGAGDSTTTTATSTRAAPQAPLPGLPVEWPALALPFGDGHRHDDVRHHLGRSTPNFQVVGWDPLVTEAHGATSGGYFCGGLASAGERTYAVTHGFENDLALIVVDVTEPEAPQRVGELVLPRTHVWDVHVFEDARYAVLAIDPTEFPGRPDNGPLAPATVPLRLSWHDACGREHRGPETEIPYLPGVLLVDLADITQPAVADFVAQPLLGGHSVFAGTVGGERYVLVGVTNLLHQASYFSLFTVVESPVAPARLAPHSMQSAHYPVIPEGPVPVLNGHLDGWIQEHPITGDAILYLANSNGGFITMRIDGPGRLTPLGLWNDFQPSRGSGMTGAIHTVYPLAELRDGRHITIVGQEVAARPADRPTGQIILFDTTDPASPTPLARWTLPADVEWGGFLMFTTHYMDVLGDTMFVAMWHGGVWAVSIAEEHWPELPSLGVFLPDRESPSPPPAHLGQFVRYSPIVLDVFVTPTGHVVIFDGPGGIYTLAFDPTLDVPVPMPWTADAWL